MLQSQHSQLSTEQRHRVNQNKQNGQTFCEKVKLTRIFNWLERSFSKTNHNSGGLLLYVDNLARVLATWVKNLLLLCIKIKANFKIPLCAELVSFCCLLRVKSRQDVMHSILTNNFLLFVTTLYSKHYSQKYGNCCEEFPTRTQAYCSKFLSAQILF